MGLPTVGRPAGGSLAVGGRQATSSRESGYQPKPVFRRPNGEERVDLHALFHRLDKGTLWILESRTSVDTESAFGGEGLK